MKGSTLEMRMVVWDDGTGERIEVGDDSDSLGLVEIRFVSDDGKAADGIRFKPEDADKIANAITSVAKFIADREAREP